MPTKVFVKSKAPVLVRAYNFFLFICGRIHLIKYEVDCFKYLKLFSKEKNKPIMKHQKKHLISF